MSRVASTTLEQQLAERLREVYKRAPRRSGAAWEAVAKECLRQMEWAQDEGINHYAVNMEPGYKNPPVTLAPNGWNF